MENYLLGLNAGGLLDLIFLISLNELLTPMTKKIVLLDGGMGQELIKRSGQKPTPLWSARVLLDNPELVQELHSDFIKAGAQVISLNNYTATPFRLRRDASIDLFDEIHQSAKTVAKALVDHFICHYGIPKRLHSDQGGSFEGKVMKQFCTMLGISKSRTTPYHPEVNGSTERMNRTLISMLRTLDPSTKKTVERLRAMVSPCI